MKNDWWNGWWTCEWQQEEGWCHSHLKKKAIWHAMHAVVVVVTFRAEAGERWATTKPQLMDPSGWMKEVVSSNGPIHLPSIHTQHTHTHTHVPCNARSTMFKKLWLKQKSATCHWNWAHSCLLILKWWKSVLLPRSWVIPNGPSHHLQIWIVNHHHHLVVVVVGVINHHHHHHHLSQQQQVHWREQIKEALQNIFISIHSHSHSANKHNIHTTSTLLIFTLYTYIYNPSCKRQATSWAIDYFFFFFVPHTWKKERIVHNQQANI